MSTDHVSRVKPGNLKLVALGKKSSIFLLIAAVFNSTDVFKCCIDRYLKLVWKIALLVMSTVMYHNVVSTSMNCKHRGLRSGTGVIFFFTEPAGAGKQTPFEHSLHTLKVAISAAADTFYPQIASVINFQEAGEQNIGGSNAKIMGCRHSSGC